MRFVLLTLTIAVIAVSAATLRPEMTDNAGAYANTHSREYAKGETGKANGWRECAELENTPKEVGEVCEGTRTISLPNGQLADVNYFCEFRFLKVDTTWLKLDYSLCQ
jgi:hypothetical protein